jgi:small subunit ribosomal protein S20
VATAKIAVSTPMRLERPRGISGTASVGAVTNSLGAGSDGSVNAGRRGSDLPPDPRRLSLEPGTEGAIVRRRPAVSPGAYRTMANIHSQKKRILRAERERQENRRYTSSIKTYFRRLEQAVAADENETADAEHRVLVRTIDKAVKRGALHRNNGARKKSRAARVRRGA